MISKIDYENSLIRLECCRDNLNLLVAACETHDFFISNAVHCVEFELIELHKEFSNYFQELQQQDSFSA